MTPSKGNGRLMAFGDEEPQLQAFDDWGIEIDADGNVIPSVEEPGLPRLPLPDVEEGAIPIQQDDFMPFDNQGDVIMGGGENIFEFPSDPPIPPQLIQEQEGAREQEPSQTEEEVAMEDETSSGQAPVRAQRKRRRLVLAPDDQTKITRHELKSWSANYLDNAERASHPRQGVTITEARKNAFNLIFGSGIANIGFSTGVPGLSHPLAHQFAGEGLQAQLLGILIHNNEEEKERPRGRRRSALEALELEEDNQERRVRRRLSDENEEEDHAAQQLPQLEDDALPLLVDDENVPEVEVGRRAGSTLPDIPSDVPWNRPSSQIPSSSVKGKAPSRQVSASPLHGRGSIIPGPEIERFSDQPVFGSDDLGFAPLLHSGGGSDSILPPHPQHNQHSSSGTPATSQAMLSALDREGSKFFAFLSAVAQDKGYSHDEDNNNNSSNSNNNRYWVEFDSLFEPEDQKRAVVAQAFYHVLSLATKNVIRVKQDGQGGHEPFGAIHVGVKVQG